MKGEVLVHYCGKDIQYELIGLMGKKVRNHIVRKEIEVLFHYS